MNYTKSQKEALDKVMEVFSDYLATNQIMDVIWSDKLGYVMLSGINGTQDFIGMQPEILQDAATLCRHLLYEIASDVIQENGEFQDFHLIAPHIQEKVKQRVNPYISKIPEYEYLVDRLFEIPE